MIDINKLFSLINCILFCCKISHTEIYKIVVLNDYIKNTLFYDFLLEFINHNNIFTISQLFLECLNTIGIILQIDCILFSQNRITVDGK